MAEQGNVAAMRKALIVAKANLDSMGGNALEGELNFDAVAMICASMYARIDAALAAPPRNCDVGTADEQADRFKAFCYAHRTHANECSKECPFNDTSAVCYCQARWAQMPFAPAEGGAE